MTAELVAEFEARWEAAAAKIRADYAGLTPAQRVGPARSARIKEIRLAYLGLTARHASQITIARLGYDLECARGYGDDKALANLARAGHIVILPDRQRRPQTVYHRKARS